MADRQPVSLCVSPCVGPTVVLYCVRGECVGGSVPIAWWKIQAKKKNASAFFAFSHFRISPPMMWRMQGVPGTGVAVQRRRTVTRKKRRERDEKETGKTRKKELEN